MYYEKIRNLLCSIIFKQSNNYPQNMILYINPKYKNQFIIINFLYIGWCLKFVETRVLQKIKLTLTIPNIPVHTQSRKNIQDK